MCNLSMRHRIDVFPITIGRLTNRFYWTTDDFIFTFSYFGANTIKQLCIGRANNALVTFIGCMSGCRSLFYLFP